MSSEFRCKFCTFINARGTRICDACGKSLNLPDINLNPEGVTCTSCTYSNPVGSNTCEMCANALPLSLSQSLSDTDTSVTLNSSGIGCPVCCLDVGTDFQMPGCSHTFCLSCAERHFRIKITECGINTFRCPIGECTSFDELQNKATFFEDLKLVLIGILDAKTYKIMANKIEILDIMDEPGFLRCALCNHGFIHQSKSKMVYCAGCKESFCSNCSQKWRAGHSQTNCTSKTNIKDESLMFTNATCPKCKYKYFLEGGGCMHITCSQCSYEYCEFCFKKITGNGKRCDYQNCTKSGLHGHHPRNCMYYVREMDHKKLEKLLKKKGIRIATQSSKTSTCTKSECNSPAELSYNNECLCLLHYKWRLGELMKKHDIDPVDIMDNKECFCELTRNYIPLRKNITSCDQPIEDEHTPDLRTLVRSQIPYEKIAQ